MRTPARDVDGRRPRDRTWVVALAAVLWGLSGLFREPLSRQFPSLTIVLWEHLIVTVLICPWLLPAFRALAAASMRTKVSVLTIGAGSSALATTMFTAAFAFGDPITPQVLQKLQPLIAVLLAVVLLRERLTPRFLLFAVPALGGAWLMSFPDPLSVTVAGVQAAALALGAAALWASGTVLGRAVSAELSFLHVTTLRFAVGLVTLLAIAGVVGVPLSMPVEAWPQLLMLALIPGLAALILYYIGLRTTAASRATFAELAFPISAALVGVLFLDGRLDGSQWFGLVMVVSAIVALALNGSRGAHPVVIAPDVRSKSLTTTEVE